MKNERIIELIDEHLEEPNSMSKEWGKALRKIRGKLMKKQPAFPWEDFETKKVVVHCDTEEKAREFLKKCEKRGYKWALGSDCTSKTEWDDYKIQTCYARGIFFANVEYYANQGYSVIEYPVAKIQKKQSADKPLTIKKMVEEAYATARSKGMYEGQDTTDITEFAAHIAHLNREASEALEEADKGTDTDLIYYFQDEHGKEKPCGIPIELADVVIYAASMCGHYGIDLDNAIKIKMEYNKGREYKHGKVF